LMEQVVSCSNARFPQWKGATSFLATCYEFPQNHMAASCYKFSAH
jgi:hypothetical protein